MLGISKDAPAAAGRRGSEVTWGGGLAMASTGSCCHTARKAPSHSYSSTGKLFLRPPLLAGPELGDKSA